MLNASSCNVITASSVWRRRLKPLLLLPYQSAPSHLVHRALGAIDQQWQVAAQGSLDPQGVGGAHPVLGGGARELGGQRGGGSGCRGTGGSERLKQVHGVLRVTGQGADHHWKVQTLQHNLTTSSEPPKAYTHTQHAPTRSGAFHSVAAAERSAAATPAAALASA